MKKISIPLLICLLLWYSNGHGQTGSSITLETSIQYNDELLEKIRLAANAIPGPKANEIRYVKFAESPRTFAQTIEGGNDKPYIQARTAYQIMFDKEWVMVDSGMDKQVHNFFGMGKRQPYFESANDTIQKALSGAREIIITHEHGDHVAGVVRSSNYSKLAPKTLLTAQMAKTLVENPQMPLLQLTKEQLKDFTIIDFQDILPVAPGLVLIKAPGHTPGEIMVYIQFENGTEYLITGDVSWSYAGINEKKQKPDDQIKRIGENATTISFQLEWLNNIQKQGIQLLVNHDDIIQPELVKISILTQGFKLTK